MKKALNWRPVSVGQIVAESNVRHDEGTPLPYRVTFKYGEGDWIGMFEGVVVFRGTLDAVLEACDEAELYDPEPTDNQEIERLENEVRKS